MPITREPINLYLPTLFKSVQTEVYTLVSVDHKLVLTVLSYGATLCRVVHLYGNCEIDLIASFPSMDNYADPNTNTSYLGATLGRFSRCIREGKFELEDVQYQLNQNICGHHFHGGIEGFDKRFWETKEVVEREDVCALHLYLVSEDRDQGYPGEVNAEVIYQISGSNRISVEYKAITTKTTHVSLTNHSFWTLGSDSGIDQLFLNINGEKTIDTDCNLIPTGRISSVLGTSFDFQKRRLISKIQLDKCFVLHGNKYAMDLFNPKNGVGITMTTNQPVLAVYTDDLSSTPRRGICLQATCWPDSPNHLNFDSTVLKPGEFYHRFIDYVIYHNNEKGE